MLVAGQEFSEQLIERIRVRVAGDSTLTRSGLSREVCTWLDWRGAHGRLKEVNCRVALLKLARRGMLELPPARSQPCAQRAAQAVGEACWPIVQSTLGELGRVWLLPVEGGQARLSKQWWTMLRAHHPLGAGPLCGAQLRYLVVSDAGVLGALSFSAAAWRLAARDQWIGWDDATRQAQLPKVVANSRFLILPTVKVANLASHVLSLAAARIAEDWQARYGIAPLLLETFVDATGYRGTCYRAANWIHLGHTQGRGRQDRRHSAQRTRKDIWVYPLQAQWRARLCARSPVAPVDQRREPGDWADEEFGGCVLSDARLSARLLTLARDFYARPMANVPQACASRAKTKAAYRFLEHAETTMDTLLQPHYRATQARVSKQAIVLAVQDSTSLDYTTHRATEGLGAIGSWPQGPQGLHLHSTLAFSEQGTPLGFLDVQCWARDRAAFGKKQLRHQLPIEQKESYKWLKSYRALVAVQARCPDTTLVSVGDREADLYELFAEAASHRAGPKLLVRARHDRQLQSEQLRLWQTLQAQPLAGVQVLQVPRQGSRAAREAKLAIRYAAVSLLAPSAHQGAPALGLWAVHAQEQQPADGLKPLQWLLLTTLPVMSFEHACEKLLWYTRRWGIEVLHRTLKSGCRIEQRQLGHADRLEACLAIDLVVAWRIYHLNQLGRAHPDVACTLYFQDAEWKALMMFTARNPLLPSKPPSLREAIRLVAGLGGFLGRKADGEPGTQTLWLGLQRLDDITTAISLMMGNATQTPVSSGIDSG